MSSLALLSGCKGNTSSAASYEKAVTAPPHVLAYQTLTDARLADPLTSGLWNGAHWLALTTPIGTERTTASAYGTMLFDANTLYVAFISQKPTHAFTQDMVSVYLDTSATGSGAEMVQVAVNSAGRASCTWIRDAQPPVRAKDDGSPDIFHPLSKIPVDATVTGLFTKTGVGTFNGLPVWTAVVAIPLQSLPTPLRATPVAGSQWKINLIRTTLIGEPNSNLEQLQANLSPVYVGQQAVAPYRMATLELVNAQVSAAQ
jgi:hypothetical protein